MKVLVNGMRLVDHMMVSSYLRCWNYYFFKYILGLSDPAYSEALVLGIMFHSALAKWYDTYNLEETEKEFLNECDNYGYKEGSTNALNPNHPRSINNTLEKLRTYCGIYKNDYFTPIGSEIEHFVKMEARRRYGNYTKSASRTTNATLITGESIWYVGHVDCVGKINNELCFLEHKTTSLYEQSPLLEAYAFGLQVKGYTMCLMDKYNLNSPCPGYIDIIFLRSKTRNNATLRYPITFDESQMDNFKTNLSFVIGEMLWKERHLKEWTIPDPSRCTCFNRVCEYKEACDLLPNMKLCHEFLLRRQFTSTMPARLDKIEKESSVKEPGKLYYKIEKGASL